MDSMRKKCQKLWIKAMEEGEEVRLKFTNSKDRERAKFSLYECTRRETDIKLIRARELCEIRKDDGNVLIISLKSKNPYHGQLEDQMNSLLGEEGENTIDNSLRKFEEKLKEGQKVERPSNPYFNREEK